MKAVVTGSNGLIGANLVRELIRDGWHVAAMVRRQSRLDTLKGLPVDLVTGDVLQPAIELAPLMKGADVVFHAAAHFAYAGHTADELERTAVEGTRNVLEAAAASHVQRVVLTSTSVVFGSSKTDQVRDENARLDWRNDDGFVEPPYVISKVKQDLTARELAASLGIEIVFVCPTMSVGPISTSLGPSNGMILAYLSDPWRLTYPGGCNIVSTKDVAIGHLLAAVQGIPGEHYVLGGENLTWIEVHTLIAELCGVERPKSRINHTLAFSAAIAEELAAFLQQRTPLATRQQARMIGRYYWYSNAKAAAIGFRPTSARNALARACAWLAESEHVSRDLRATMLLSREVYDARSAGEVAFA